MSNEYDLITAFSSVRLCNGDVQETYPTGSGEAKRRASHLRSLGYDVRCASLGPQITSLGRMNLTIVRIEPGVHAELPCPLPQTATTSRGQAAYEQFRIEVADAELAAGWDPNP